MDIDTLFSHLNSVSNSIQTHWNFFSVVALGVATTLAIKAKKFERLVGVLMIIGIGIFLISNLYRIDQASTELRVVESAIKDQILKHQLTPELTTDFKALYSNDYSRVNRFWFVFHLIIDISVILVIVWRTEWRKQNNKAYQAKP